PPVERVPPAGPRGSEQIAFGLARRDSSARVECAIAHAAAEPRPVEVTLDAEQHGAHRIVEPHRTAEQRAVGIEDVSPGAADHPLAAAQAVTAVEAEINSGPVGIRT